MSRVPQFKDVRFGSDGDISKAQRDFKKWLRNTRKWEVTFKDQGQDLQQMNINETGEILTTDFQGRIYNGQFVNVEFLKPGSPLLLAQGDEWKAMYGLVIETIETFK